MFCSLNFMFGGCFRTFRALRSTQLLLSNKSFLYAKKFFINFENETRKEIYVENVVVTHACTYYSFETEICMMYFADLVIFHSNCTVPI